MHKLEKYYFVVNRCIYRNKCALPQKTYNVLCCIIDTTTIRLPVENV